MPEINIGIILVIVASLSTFLFATKELLMNPPQTHHYRRQLSIDPKTVTYKSHGQSNYQMANTKQQVISADQKSHPGNMPQYSSTKTKQTTGGDRMTSVTFPLENSPGSFQQSQALLQRPRTQGHGFNGGEQEIQTTNTKYGTKGSQRSESMGLPTVDTSQVAEWNSDSSTEATTNDMRSSNDMSSGGHSIAQERSSFVTSSDSGPSSGGLWSSDERPSTVATNSNRNPLSLTGGLRSNGDTVSGYSNPEASSRDSWSSNGASSSDSYSVPGSRVDSSGTSYHTASSLRGRIPSESTVSSSSGPKESSEVVWSFNEGKSVGNLSPVGKDSDGSGMSAGRIQSFDEQSSGSLFSSSSGFSSGGFSSGSSRVPSGGLRSSSGASSGYFEASSSAENSGEQMNDSMIPHTGSNGMLQREVPMQKPRRKLEFVHITKTGGTAIETAAADQANIMWGACHYRSIKYQKCDSPDWPKVQRRIDERMPAGLKYVGEPWHCPTQWQLPYMFENVDTFVVVRNPYERVVSEYYCSSYGYKGPNPDLVETFNHWVYGNVTEVTRALHGHMLPQAYYVYDENGNKIIDHVIRYENLSAEFDALMVEYGLPIKLPSKKEGIPMFHTYNRKGVSHSQQMTVNELSPENIAKINEVYARDFELFGYRIL